MEVTVDRLLQIIGSQHVELIMARTEIEQLKKQYADLTGQKEEKHLRPVRSD